MVPDGLVGVLVLAAVGGGAVALVDAALEVADRELVADAHHRELTDAVELLDLRKGDALERERDPGQAQRAHQAVAARDVALANYRLSVLTAYQEVEDNLVATVQLQAQEQAQRQAWEAARRNLELTQAQYLAGTVSHLNVVLAQTSALSAERAWLDVQSRRWMALNKLMAAGLRF